MNNLRPPFSCRSCKPRSNEEGGDEGGIWTTGTPDCLCVFRLFAEGIERIDNTVVIGRFIDEFLSFKATSPSRSILPLVEAVTGGIWRCDLVSIFADLAVFASYIVITTNKGSRTRTTHKSKNTRSTQGNIIELIYETSHSTL